MFDFLYPEIHYDIFQRLDIVSLYRLSRTCKYYQNIFSPDYNYVWKSLVSNLMNFTFNYLTIRQYNGVNNTDFSDWFELYKYVYTYSIGQNEIIDLCCDGHIDMVKFLMN